MDLSNICTYILKCISSESGERQEGLKFIEDAQKQPTFAPLMLKLSSDYNQTTEIQQLTAILLKNFIQRHWQPSEKDGFQNISPEDKQIIKENILNLLPRCKTKMILKLYTEIIKKILKYENQWNEFIPKVIEYLKSQNPFEILCGVSSFYQMSLVYEFELDERKEIYNGCFAYVLDNLERLMEGIIQVTSVDLNNFSDDNTNQITMKILYKILKIFFTTIQMGIPRVLIERSRFEKWLNFLDFFIKCSPPETCLYLLKKPSNLEELAYLRKSKVWKIKYICYDSLHKFYEKYGDISKISKKETELKDFAEWLNNTYSTYFYEKFLLAIYQSKENYVEEEILCLAYNYLQLVINRKDVVIIEILHGQVDTLIKNYIVQGALLNMKDLDLIESDPKNHIYKQYQKGQSFESLRIATCEFLEKLCNYKTSVKSAKINGKRQRKRPEYFDFIYEYLINCLNSLESEIKSNPSNLNFLLLHKEACIKLLESISHLIVDYLPANLEIIISNYLVNDIDQAYHLSNGIVRERAFSFIYTFANTLKIKNNDLLSYVVHKACSSMSAQTDLCVCLKSALLIPRLMSINTSVVELFRNNIAEVFTIYLKLMQELDLDQILKCLEDFVTVFPKEILQFSVDLTKELIEAFNRFIKFEESNPSSQNELNYFQQDLDDSFSEENYSLQTALGVMKTLNKLLAVCSKENSELFYQIENLVSPLLFWCFQSDKTQVFKELIDIIDTISHSPVAFSNNAWLLYPELLNSIVVKDETVKEGISPGFGWECLTEITASLINYIIKEPEIFFYSNNKDGLSLLNITIEYVPKIVLIAKKEKDEVCACCSLKILMTILETYKENLDFSLKSILYFIMEEMKTPKMSMYQSLLIQTIALCYIYNPNYTNIIIEEMNLTQSFLDVWTSSLKNYRFDFEYRRTAMAFTSFFLIEENKLNPVLKNNMRFIFSQILDLLQKCREIRERKKKKEIEEVNIC
jgi:hypothetical protein